MALTSIPFARLLRRALASSVPAAIVLAILAGLGALDPGVAVIVFLAVVLPAFGLFLIVYGDYAAVGRYLEELLHHGKASAPRTRVSKTARDLAHGIDRLNRERAERIERLEAQSDEIEKLLQALPDPLLLLDGERRIARANRAAGELFGDNLLGRDLASALRNPSVLDAVEAAHKKGKGLNVEFALQHPIERSFLARIEPQMASAAESQATLLILHDLTELKRSEQMRADFVANASHEIRTPLASLVGFIETLRGPAKDDPEAQERFLALMEQQATRMTRLVDDLLSLSRIEIHEHQPPTGRVELKRLLESLRENLEWEAEERKATIALDLAEDLPPAVGEEVELAQLFHNLIDNAIKYGRTGGTVTVTSRLLERAPVGVGWRSNTPGALSIAVADQGEGIGRTHIPRLTERFYRVDTARSRELGGTGLGLAIVKHIVNRHRGLLKVESETGKGSVFTVYLEPARAHHPEKAEPRPRKGNSVP